MALGRIGTPGTMFRNRIELLDAGVHRQREGGIGGSGVPGAGAESVVLSDGYEDDVDNGDTILYTGHGGRDRRTGRQISDQEFTRLNKSLAENVKSGQPVRVIRKVPGGFRYDGLYSVDDAYDVLGVSGYRICRFELTRIADDSAVPSPTPAPVRPSRRTTGEVTRVVRDTARPLRVKSLHGYRCQVCGISLTTRQGGYAEGAHIIPVGRPHDGPDHETNILCLCPNHHVLLDHCGIYLTDDHVVFDRNESEVGKLRQVADHSIDRLRSNITARASGSRKTPAADPCPTPAPRCEELSGWVEYDARRPHLVPPRPTAVPRRRVHEGTWR
jgi:putative restriction endonuclease